MTSMLGMFEEQANFLRGNVFHIKNIHFGCLICIFPIIVFALSYFPHFS